MTVGKYRSTLLCVASCVESVSAPRTHWQRATRAYTCFFTSSGVSAFTAAAAFALWDVGWFWFWLFFVAIEFLTNDVKLEIQTTPFTPTAASKLVLLPSIASTKLSFEMSFFAKGSDTRTITEPAFESGPNVPSPVTQSFLSMCGSEQHVTTTSRSGSARVTCAYTRSPGRRRGLLCLLAPSKAVGSSTARWADPMWTWYCPLAPPTCFTMVPMTKSPTSGKYFRMADETSYWWMICLLLLFVAAAAESSSISDVEVTIDDGVSISVRDFLNVPATVATSFVFCCCCDDDEDSTTCRPRPAMTVTSPWSSTTVSPGRHLEPVGTTSVIVGRMKERRDADVNDIIFKFWSYFVCKFKSI